MFETVLLASNKTKPQDVAICFLDLHVLLLARFGPTNKHSVNAKQTVYIHIYIYTCNQGFSFFKEAKTGRSQGDNPFTHFVSV